MIQLDLVLRITGADGSESTEYSTWKSRTNPTPFGRARKSTVNNIRMDLSSPITNTGTALGAIVAFLLNLFFNGTTARKGRELAVELAGM